MDIRPFRESDATAVVALWERCGLTRPWNDPHKDIQRKLGVQREWFIVGEIGGEVIASAMAGYDGHRGWIYYLAVDSAYQRQGHAQALVAEAERLLGASGCPKVNLMVRSDNAAVIEFYQRLGYGVDQCLCLGKRLEHDAPRCC